MAMLLALACLLAGGIVLAIGEVVTVPVPVLALALLGFVLGVLAISGLTYRRARRDGSSLPTAFGRCVAAGFRAIIEFM